MISRLIFVLPWLLLGAVTPPSPDKAPPKDEPPRGSFHPGSGQPVDLTEAGLGWTVPVTLDSSRARLVVDTGSYTSVFTRFAHTAGLMVLPFPDGVPRPGYSGYAMVQALSCGTARWTKAPVAILEPESVRPVGARADGFLGVDKLAEALVEIGAGGKTISFSDASRFEPQGDDIPIEREYLARAGFLVVRAEVDGKPGRVLVDTGAQISMVGRSLGADLQGEPDEGTVVLHNFGGNVPVTFARAHRIRLGTFAVENVRVAIADKLPLINSAASSSRRFPHLAGIIGRDVLRRFNVTLAIKAGFVRLSRGEN